MHVRYQHVAAGKAGNTPEDYEDACWPRCPLDADVPVFRVALADGATETSFASLWANLLVRAHCRGRLHPENLTAGLTPLRRRWMRDVGTGPLPWYAEAKVLQGAFASLLGLWLREDGCWRAWAVGDTCLVHMRGDDPVCMFPYDQASQFTSRPVLIPSRIQAGQIERAEEIRGAWESDDFFLLMTDAVACWFLAGVEAGREPWHELSAVLDENRLDEWLDCSRTGGAMRNDDVTVALVTVR